MSHADHEGEKRVLQVGREACAEAFGIPGQVNSLRCLERGVLVGW